MSYRRELIPLHIAVFLLGFTGLFAKWISLAPVAIVAWRCGFTVLCLSGLALQRRVPFRLPRKHFATLAISGGLLAGHWMCFYHAIQQSTVAIGLIGFATFPIFVTLLEPLFFRESYRGPDIVSAILAAIGLAVAAPVLHWENAVFQALLWAVFSALLLALFTLNNRHLVRATHFLPVSMWQHAIAGLCALPFALSVATWPNFEQWVLLVVLGSLFTAVPQLLLVRALRVVKAQLSSVLVGLEPVYAILFAWLLLNEVPGLDVLAGGGLIILAVVIATRSHDHIQLSVQNRTRDL